MSNPLRLLCPDISNALFGDKNSHQYESWWEDACTGKNFHKCISNQCRLSIGQTGRDIDVSRRSWNLTASSLHKSPWPDMEVKRRFIKLPNCLVLHWMYITETCRILHDLAEICSCVLGNSYKSITCFYSVWCIKDWITLCKWSYFTLVTQINIYWQFCSKFENVGALSL